MSLSGRYLIDRLKRAIGHSFRLPVPPYGDAEYWDAAYRSLGPQDSYEWGDISLNELMKYDYRPIDWATGKPSNTKMTTTLAKTLGIPPNAEQDEPMLMLGCGNSEMGEQMIHAGWRGPLIQVDVSARVIDTMSQRCGHLIQDGHMNFKQDDATELSAFRNDMIQGCLDKGLIDAIFCADEFDQCSQVMKSVHRVLRPGGSFVFLSFSRPEFLLPNIFDRDHRRNRALWEDVQIQELSQIMLYKFQKATAHGNQQPISPRNKKR